MLQELRDAITSTEWSEGNPDVILEVANKLNRRISSNFSDQADLIKIFETLQNKFFGMDVNYTNWEIDSNL